MTKYIGRRVSLGVGRESGARGTPVISTYWIPKVDFTFDDKVTKARILSSLGVIEDSHQAHVLTKWGEGDVGGEVRSESFGPILYSLLGSLSTGVVVDSSYTHTFTVANSNQHASMTFVVIDPNTTERYELVMLNSLELTQELEDVLRFNANFLGRTSKVSGGTAAFIDEDKFTKRHLEFKVASNIAGLGAASAVSIKAVNITFTKNVVPDDAMGTAVPEDFLNQAFSVEGSITLNYNDETWKNYMINNTSRAMQLVWTNTEQTISIGTTNPSLTIQLSKVDFFDWEPNYALDEIVTQTISFKANYDLGGQDNMVNTISLVNEQDGTDY